MAASRPGEVEARLVDYEVDGARLLERVELSARRGMLVGLIGPNGAGKSTLLRVLAGVVRNTGGEVVLEGDALRRLSAGEVARRLALVAQHTPETHGFSALEVVLTGRYPHLGRLEIEGERDRAVALQAMEQTGTTGFAARNASTLSGGERQRVFIARGLAQQPRVLLLDEPTASLDVRHQLAMLELMLTLARHERMTVIVAIHDLRLAARYCDHLALIDRGRIVADGSPREVLTPEHLSAVFGVDAVVYEEPFTGTLTVDFHPRDETAEHMAPARVHVRLHPESATEGATLLFALRRAGLLVTVDGTAEGGIDRFVAEALGIPLGPIAGGGTDLTVDFEGVERDHEPAAWRCRWGSPGAETTSVLTLPELVAAIRRRCDVTTGQLLDTPADRALEGTAP